MKNLFLEENKHVTFHRKRKKNIVNLHLKFLANIADKEYQERVWIRAAGPEIDSYIDTVENFFIACDSIVENYKEFNLTDDQYKIFKKFRDQFRIFVDNDEGASEREFIDSPEWAAIVELAGEVLEEFNYKRTR